MYANLSFIWSIIWKIKIMIIFLEFNQSLTVIPLNNSRKIINRSLALWFSESFERRIENLVDLKCPWCLLFVTVFVYNLSLRLFKSLWTVFFIFQIGFQIVGTHISFFEKLGYVYFFVNFQYFTQFLLFFFSFGFIIHFY